MEFKTPLTTKRPYDDSVSPCNKKKTKLELQLIDSESESRTTETDPFDDNFSQFFRTQFIKQIDDAEISANKIKNTSTSCDLNFTEIDGLSQFLDNSQFETSISAGQRYTENESNTLKPEKQDAAKPENDSNDIWDLLLSEEELKQLENDAQYEEVVEYEADAEGASEPIIQSSQAFLREVSALHLNISSIVNETINANKFCTQDFLDPNQFEIYKSNVTESQYSQRKRPKKTINLNLTSKGKTLKHDDGRKSISSQLEIHNPPSELDTEMIEDQFLAEMILTTQVLMKSTEKIMDKLMTDIEEEEEFDISGQLNGCIDPDSSALALLSDEDERENKENAEIQVSSKNEPKEQQITKVMPNSTVTAIKQRTLHHSPVTASNYYSMGPFFGLPIKVKKLIKTFKNIDDLYGKKFFHYYSKTIIIF